MSLAAVQPAPETTPVAEERPALPRANRAIRMPEFELGERLTQEQRDWLDTFGFIKFKRFVPRQVALELAAELEEVDRKICAEGRTSINGVPLIIGTRPDGSKYVQRMVFASLFSEKLSKFLKDPRFAAILEVAGDGFRIGERERDGLVVNHFRREDGSAYSKLGWHTDSLRDVFYFEKPRKYLNTGFYLDDSPIEKGGVRLLPCSQNQNLLTLLTRKIHFMDHAPDPEEYAIEAEAGDLTIHDGRLWHRVATATWTGEQSRRRVMYIPLMNGPVKLKDENSRPPLYLKLRKLAGY
jgi:hypothetical protein